MGDSVPVCWIHPLGNVPASIGEVPRRSGQAQRQQEPLQRHQEATSKHGGVLAVQQVSDEGQLRPRDAESPLAVLEDVVEDEPPHLLLPTRPVQLMHREMVEPTAQQLVQRERQAQVLALVARVCSFSHSQQLAPAAVAPYRLDGDELLLVDSIRIQLNLVAAPNLYLIYPFPETRRYCSSSLWPPFALMEFLKHAVLAVHQVLVPAHGGFLVVLLLLLLKGGESVLVAHIVAQQPHALLVICLPFSRADEHDNDANCIQGPDRPEGDPEEVEGLHPEEIG